jgi:SAM-dependent methyltransferase
VTPARPLAPGPRAYAPDGSPVEAFARLPHGAVPDLIHAAVPPGTTSLELGCGAGRVTHRLLDLGHPVVAVDQSPEMLAHVRGAETVLADIEGLDLGRRFDGVVLASYLVNTPDDAQRAAFLATCARHVAPAGVVLVQRLDPELVPVAVDASSEEDGITYSIADVQHHGDLFSATVGFTIAGRRWEHPYRGLVLDDRALGRHLAGAGLQLRRFLDPQRTWVEAVA